MIILLGLLLVCLIAVKPEERYEGTIDLHKRVEAAIILDEKHKANPRGRRRYSHAINFMQTLFKNNNLTIHVDPPLAEGAGGSTRLRRTLICFSFKLGQGQQP